MHAFMLSHFSRVWLCDPTDFSPPGSSVHGFLLATILEGLLCPPPGDLPNSERTRISYVSCTGRWVLYHWHYWEDTLEKEMAIHSSILACKLPWTEETGGPQSLGVTKESDMTLQLNSRFHPQNANKQGILLQILGWRDNASARSYLSWYELLWIIPW